MSGVHSDAERPPVSPDGKGRPGQRQAPRRIEGGPSPTGLGGRFLWFVAFYAGGLAAFTALVYFLRAVVPH